MTQPGRSSGSPHLAVAFPDFSSGVVTAGVRGLQLRGQLRIFTGFPYPDCAAKVTFGGQNPGERSTDGSRDLAGTIFLLWGWILVGGTRRKDVVARFFLGFFGRC